MTQEVAILYIPEKEDFQFRDSEQRALKFIKWDELKEEVEKITNLFSEALDNLAGSAASSLDEVEVSLGVSSEGKLSFLGSGISAAAEASIKLKFKPKRDDPNATE